MTETLLPLTLEQIQQLKLESDYRDLWYDLSDFDVFVEWDKVTAPNVIIKIGGSLWESKLGLSHAINANKAGKRVCLYYWNDPGYDPIQQADHYLSLAQKVINSGVPVYGLFVDVEQWWSDWDLWRQYKGVISDTHIPHYTDSQISENGRLMVESLEARTSITVGVYTGNWFVEGCAPSMKKWIINHYIWVSYYWYSGDRRDVTWQDLQGYYQPSTTALPIRWSWIPLDKLVLWQWTGDVFQPQGTWSIAYVRKKPIDLSCYRGRKPASEIFKFSGGNMAPILFYPCDENARMSQEFGVNLQYYQSSGGHNGIDWAIPVGNQIFAAQDGTVIRAEQTTVGYGRHVRIQSNDGVTIYGHLSVMNVKVGDVVKANQVIGLSGGATTDPYSGYSTGPHLHFEYRPNVPPTSGIPGTLLGAIDPKPYLVSKVQTAPLPELFKARCIVGTLRIRSSANLNSTTNIVGSLSYNQEVSVYAELNGCFRIDPVIQRWCSSGTGFMKRIAPVTPIPLPDWAQAVHAYLISKGYVGNPPAK